ncbi:NLI interacting factor-like phosphatase [Plasmodium gonderi]|uniref:protein-serine/threonine phosphatase n=1 Tax=Plasmodium gonderi TaxID=77519 RepID=A0A1Y1JE65_PLAGO|nr:NLI interacting factor-like phosphatase [Plasmodium gonderi]GAW80550.1 NLI interacting factor-like phosphatase [Plasmodium gonderi]
MDKERIYLPENIALPCKLKWAVDNNSIVSANQIIAFVIETTNETLDIHQNGKENFNGKKFPIKTCISDSDMIKENKIDSDESSNNIHLKNEEMHKQTCGQIRKDEENENILIDENDKISENSVINLCKVTSGKTNDTTDGMDKNINNSLISQRNPTKMEEIAKNSNERYDINNKDLKENEKKSMYEKNNVINLILNNKNNYDIKKKNSYFPLRSKIHGRIHIIKQNSNSDIDEYIYINSPNELLCEISDERCNHEVIFSGLCTNCFLNQEEINKNKKEQKYFLSPGFLTNEKELYINSDKAADLEKERISNIIKNKKLCLVLDLDNTLLHASFFVLAINMNNDIINITTDINEEMENEIGHSCNPCAYQSSDSCVPNYNFNNFNFEESYNSSASNGTNGKKEDNVEVRSDSMFGVASGVDTRDGGDDDTDDDYLQDGKENHCDETPGSGITLGVSEKHRNKHNAEEKEKGEEYLRDYKNDEHFIMNQDELYSIFCKRNNNNMEYMYKNEDIKSSYENYCDFLAKMNTINLLKYNGKFIHYENLKDENIKKKIDKLELSVLKTNVKYDKGSYTIYYKLRPGVIQFLQNMNKKYEIYLYTMGTLEHAKSCLFLLDPLKKFFGNRVFSRKDSVNGLKHLNRILPTYRSISICIDDSDYMWKESSSCIKVHGYNYFPEINFLEDIKRKPYFLTKFFALAQSYLNFSSNLYGFINFKCNEYEAMKMNSINNLLYNESSIWNDPSNRFMAAGTAYQITQQGENRIGNVNFSKEGELNGDLKQGEDTGIKIDTNAAISHNSCIKIDETDFEVENTPLKGDDDDEEEEEDCIILRGDNSINNETDSSSDIELDESIEGNFIDLDKEFETDNEDSAIVEEAKPKLDYNSYELNVNNNLKLFDDTYNSSNGKGELFQRCNNDQCSNALIGNDNLHGNINNDHFPNLYQNDDTCENISNSNFMNVSSSNPNINQKGFTQNEHDFFLNSDVYKENSENNIHMNNNMYVSHLYNQSGYMQSDQNSTYSIGINSVDCQFSRATNCEDNMNKTFSGTDSFANMGVKISKDIDKKKKKKKNNNKINNLEMKNKTIQYKYTLGRDEEYSSNSFDNLACLTTSERFVPFEDEIIYKFISERNFRKYDNYVVRFLRNYFKGERFTRGRGEEGGLHEDAHIESDGHLDVDTNMNSNEIDSGENRTKDEKNDCKKESDGETQMEEDGKWEGENEFEKMNNTVWHNLKKVEKKIKKEKIKKLTHVQNFQKKKNITLGNVKEYEDTNDVDSTPLSNNKLNNDSKGKTHQNEYYESFFIPKNLSELNFEDNDKQLHYLTTILDEIHHIFYNIFEHFKMNKTDENNQEDQIYNYFLRYPIIRTILIEFRKQALKDCIFNVSQLTDEIQRSDFMDYILKLGGSINNENYTHILTVNNFVKNENWKNAKITNLMWIERALYTWTSADTKYYDMNMWNKVHRNFWDVIEYEEGKKKKKKKMKNRTKIG